MGKFQNGCKFYSVNTVGITKLGELFFCGKDCALIMTPFQMSIIDPEDGDRRYGGARALTAYRHWAKAGKKHMPDFAAEIDALWSYWGMPGDPP